MDVRKTYHPKKISFSRLTPGINTLLSISYISLLIYIFFLARRRRGHVLPWDERPVNLIPLRNKIYFFTSDHYFTGIEKWNFYSDLLGNFILFIPFAFFLSFMYHVRNLRGVLLIALLTSIAVELIQFLLGIGVADIDDVILNTIGACTGYFFLKISKRSFWSTS